MRRTSVVLMLAAVVAGSLRAQNRELRAGGLIGFSMATFDGKDAEGTDFVFGSGGGAFLSFRINQGFAIEPGVFLVKKGAKASDSGVEVRFLLD